MFHQVKTRLTLLVVDESGMSTVEYSVVLDYTVCDDWQHARSNRRPTIPRHRRYDLA